VLIEPLLERNKGVRQVLANLRTTEDQLDAVTKGVVSYGLPSLRAAITDRRFVCRLSYVLDLLLYTDEVIGYHILLTEYVKLRRLDTERRPAAVY
jgi:hypothetical protein